MSSTTLNDRYLAIATDIAARTASDADFANLLRTDPGTALTGYGIGLDDLRGTAESPSCQQNSHVPVLACAQNSHVPALACQQNSHVPALTCQQNSHVPGLIEPE